MTDDFPEPEQWLCRYCQKAIPGAVSPYPCPGSPDQMHRRGERWSPVTEQTAAEVADEYNQQFGVGPAFPDVDQVLVVPRSDPVYSVFLWRQDSITLARLRPVLNQLRYVPDQPCRLPGQGVGLHYGPYTCTNPDPDRQAPDQWCIPCQIRAIKIELFGDPDSNHKEESP